VPPFTAGAPMSTSIPSSPNPQVRARFDDRFINMQYLSREQPYSMPTAMMENLHNDTFAFTDHANPFAPFNTHSPSSSSSFGELKLDFLNELNMIYDDE
jgi:hypothetical protein